MDHLGDDDIDLYVLSRLDEARETEIEVHYLECPGCRDRISATQELAEGFLASKAGRRRLPWSAGLAAVLGALSLGLFYEVRTLQTRGEALARHASTSVPRPDPTSSPRGGIARARWPEFGLHAPERSEALQRIELPAATPAIVLMLQAREAGSPGTAFDVTLFGPSGRTVVMTRAIPMDADGRVGLAATTTALRPGVYTAQLSGRDGVLKIPFEVVPAQTP